MNVFDVSPTTADGMSVVCPNCGISYYAVYLPIHISWFHHGVWYTIQEEP